MNHIFNNLHEEYDVNSNGLVNHLTSSGPSALIIKVLWKKQITAMKKLRKESEERNKGKALVINGKPIKGMCTKCEKYGHILTDPKCLENDENDEKQELEYKKKQFDGKCFN